MIEKNLEFNDLNDTTINGSDIESTTVASPEITNYGPVDTGTPLRPPLMDTQLNDGQKSNNKRLRTSTSPNETGESELMEEDNSVITELIERIKSLQKLVENKDDQITTLIVRQNNLEEKNKILLEKFNELKDRMDNYNEKNETNERKLNLLIGDKSTIDKIKQIEANIDSLKSTHTTTSNPNSGTSYADMLKKAEVKIISQIKDDINQSTKKEKRVIVFNLPIVTNEVEQLNSIFEIINFDKTKTAKVFRLKKKDNAIPPLIIELTDTDAKHDLIRKSKLLKTIDNLKNIYFNYDLTLNEREVLKPLLKKRNELNIKDNTRSDATEFYYGIRNNKVVKIKKNKD